MRPSSGWTRPEIARSVVVLPAPLAPSRATTSPGGDGEVEVADHGRPLVAGGEALEGDHGVGGSRAGGGAASSGVRSRSLPGLMGGGAQGTDLRGELGGGRAEVGGHHLGVAAHRLGLARRRSPCRTRARRPRRRCERTRPMSWSTSRIGVPWSTTLAQVAAELVRSRCVSRPAAGSSRQISLGRATSARATPTSLRCPWASSAGIASA